MKNTLVWPLFVGLVLGVALGFILSTQFSGSGAPKGTALLREFSFAAVAAKAGYTNWHVLEDRTYEPFPSLARSKRVARRIIAQAVMSDAELGRFTTQFQEAAKAALSAFNAVNKAHFDLVRDATKMINGSPVHSRLDLPRRYYAVGNIHGVADIGYVEEAGNVTVIVSLIEGP